jgi:hypothetical protein
MEDQGPKQVLFLPFGWCSMAGAGLRNAFSVMACQTTVTALSAPMWTRPSTTCCCAVFSVGKFGSKSSERWGWQVLVPNFQDTTIEWWL